jgi:hypothetical protein
LRAVLGQAVQDAAPPELNRLMSARRCEARSTRVSFFDRGQYSVDESRPILIAGYFTKNSRAQAFAMFCCPVQISAAHYPGSSPTRTRRNSAAFRSKVWLKYQVVKRLVVTTLRAKPKRKHLSAEIQLVKSMRSKRRCVSCLQIGSFRIV